MAGPIVHGAGQFTAAGQPLSCGIRQPVHYCAADPRGVDAEWEVQKLALCE
jgi:hypothetical protein